MECLSHAPRRHPRTNDTVYSVDTPRQLPGLHQNHYGKINLTDDLPGSRVPDEAQAGKAPTDATLSSTLWKRDRVRLQTIMKTCADHKGQGI